MPATTTAQSQDDGITDVTNIAVKNIVIGLHDLIQREAKMVSEVKAEMSGSGFDPFVNYQVEQALMEYLAGVLNTTRHVFQLAPHFSNYTVDKMLPTQDTSSKGEV